MTRLKRRQIIETKVAMGLWPHPCRLEGHMLVTSGGQVPSGRPCSLCGGSLSQRDSWGWAEPQGLQSSAGTSWFCAACREVWIVLE